MWLAATNSFSPGSGLGTHCNRKRRLNAAVLRARLLLRNDHARIYSPRKRQRAVQTRTDATQRRTALLKYLGWGDRDTLHTTVASSRAGVRCGTQLVRTRHPACSILHWGIAVESAESSVSFSGARGISGARTRRGVAAGGAAARGGAWRRVAGD